MTVRSSGQQSLGLRLGEALLIDLLTLIMLRLGAAVWRAAWVDWLITVAAGVALGFGLILVITLVMSLLEKIGCSEDVAGWLASGLALVSVLAVAWLKPEWDDGHLQIRLLELLGRGD